MNTNEYMINDNKIEALVPLSIYKKTNEYLIVKFQKTPTANIKAFILDL